MTQAAKTEEPKTEKPKSSVPARREGPGAAIAHSTGATGVPMPRNMTEVYAMAATMKEAGPMIGKAFRGNGGACMAIIMQSMRWGLDPFACSQKAYQASKNDPNAPIAYEAQLVHAIIIKNAPLDRRLRCSYTGDGPERQCTVTGYLDGESEPFEYTSPPLKTCKKNSPLWIDDPDQQLWYYSGRAWARRYCPDIIMGVYTPDEVASMPEAKAGGETITLTGGAQQEAERPADDTIEAEYDESDPGPEDDDAADMEADGAAVGDRDPDHSESRDEDSGEGDAVESEDGDGSGDLFADDETVVASCETVRGAMNRKVAVIDNRGALNRIAETGEADLAKRAADLIDKYGQ